MIERIADLIESVPILERVTRTPEFIAYGRVAVTAAATYKTIEAINNPTAANIVTAIALDAVTTVSIGGAIIRDKAARIQTN